MIAILQPFVPHYREEFFRGIDKAFDTDIYGYEAKGNMEKRKFRDSGMEVKQLGAINLGPFLLYNPFVFTRRRYSALVLMLHFGHLTTWLLILTRFMHRRKIILWGHGISVKRYFSEKDKPSRLLKTMIALSDGVWFYTEAERDLWKPFFPNKKMLALNNTIAEVDDILLVRGDKKSLKEKYSITQQIVLIFCARFNTADRRPELLVEVAGQLDADKFALVVIGDGPLKPDFTGLRNVYDFGAVYDRDMKNELFALADLYFQPGWVGLSIVEAMAYGKGVVTLERSASLLQCVEYAYIRPGENGLVFPDTASLVKAVQSMPVSAMEQMGQSAREYVITNLSMEGMVDRAVGFLKTVEVD